MKTKDWVGDSNSIYKTLGSSNHSKEERASEDFYATDPKAMKLLLEIEKFNKKILEPSCGMGHLSKVLEQNGYEVTSRDLVDRGYGETGKDFLFMNNEQWDGDIITNPPYSKASEFIEQSINIIPDGHKVAMFLKVQFLEGKARKKLFMKYPPKTIYVSSSRILCAKNGNFKPELGAISGGGAVSYAWYIWEKGYMGDTILKWFN